MSPQRASETDAQLSKVGLRMQPYWNPQYLKNIEKWSSPKYRIRKESDVRVEVRDGTKICLDVYRPDAEGTFPSLVAISGYGKEVQTIGVPPQPVASMVFDHDLEIGDEKFFVPRGYTYVVVDPRGIGKSEGEYTGPYSVADQQDAYDVIEWTAGQPWSDGNVGMVGISWYGVMQLLTAELAPPHLKVIAPGEAYLDFYRRAYDGGVFSTFYYYLETVPNNPKLESETLYSPQELEKLVAKRLEDPDIRSISYFYKALVDYKDKRQTVFIDMLLHPTDGPFWRRRSGYPNLDKIKVPAYMFCWWGLGEFTRGAFDAFSKMQHNNKKVAMFQGAGTSGIKVRLPGIREQLPDLLRWYDYWLKGIDNGIMDEPRVRFIVEGRDQYSWADEFPPRSVTYRELYLRRFGELSLDPEESDSLPPDLMVHQSPLVLTKNDSLSYSFEFNKGTELTGPVALYLNASIDQDDGNFVALLSDLSPAGRRRPLEKSLLKASHRTLDKTKSSLESPYVDHSVENKAVPGEVYRFPFSFAPISNYFDAGHKLELVLTTEDTLPQIHHHKLFLMSHALNMRPTVFKIYRDASYQSSLVAPFVGE